MYNQPFADAPRETGKSHNGPLAKPEVVQQHERTPPPRVAAPTTRPVPPVPYRTAASTSSVIPDSVVQGHSPKPLQRYPAHRVQYQPVPPPQRQPTRWHASNRESWPGPRKSHREARKEAYTQPQPLVPEGPMKRVAGITRFDSLHRELHFNAEQRILSIVAEMHRPYGRARPGSDPVDVRCEIPPTQHVRFDEMRDGDSVELLFFRAFHGRQVIYGKPVKLERYWTSRDFAHILQTQYYHGWWLLRALKPTCIKFVYFVAIRIETQGGKSTIWARYRDIIQYEGPRTLRYFAYVLKTVKKEKKGLDRTLIRNLYGLRQDMNNKNYEKYILVEIIERISLQAILVCLTTMIILSLASTVIYGYLKQDWAGSFSLGALVAAWFTFLLATFAAWEYLGLEKLLDDKIESRTGIWKYEEP